MDRNIQMIQMIHDFSIDNLYCECARSEYTQGYTMQNNIKHNVRKPIYCACLSKVHTWLTHASRLLNTVCIPFVFQWLRSMLFKKYIHIIKYGTYLPASPIGDVETPIYHIQVICCTSRCG